MLDMRPPATGGSPQVEWTNHLTKCSEDVDDEDSGGDGGDHGGDGDDNGDHENGFDYDGNVEDDIESSSDQPLGQSALLW